MEKVREKHKEVGRKERRKKRSKKIKKRGTEGKGKKCKQTLSL